MRITGRRLAVAALLVPFLLAGSAAPAIAASPRQAEPAGCPGQSGPPGPPAPEELPVVAPLPVPDPPVSGLAVCADAYAGPVTPPPAGVASYLVADLDSGRVLAARAPHARERPASTIKLLLALVVTERLPADRVVIGTVEDANVEGSRAGLGPGGRYTVEQLLQGLLLASGNDCANALARELGGVPATLAAMRDRARDLGALDTRPATPSGLDGPGMSASAHDLALIYREALTRPRIATALTTPSVPFPGFGGRPGFELGNDDRLLGTPGFLGGKNGFTDAARHTFVGGAERSAGGTSIGTERSAGGTSIGTERSAGGTSIGTERSAGGTSIGTERSAGGTSIGAERGGRRLVVALVRGEMVPVRMVDQARALLAWGFSVPASAPGIGTLVAPGTVGSAVPGGTPAGPAPDGAHTAAPGVADPATGGGPGLPALLGGGVAVAVIGGMAWLLARRRR